MVAEHDGMDLLAAESDDVEHRMDDRRQLMTMKKKKPAAQRPTITRKLRRQDRDDIIDARYMVGCEGAPMGVPMATDLDMDTTVDACNDDHTPRPGGGKTQTLPSNRAALAKSRTWQPPRDWLARTITERVVAPADSASTPPSAELSAAKRLIRRSVIILSLVAH